MFRFHHFGVSVTFLSASLLAQTAAPVNLIPAKPLVTMHLDGPAVLRSTFLPTNLGRMFAGPEFKEMVGPIIEMYKGLKEQSGDQLPFDPVDLEKALLDYRGRLSVALHLLDDTIDFTSPNPPDFMVTILLAPDGTTDLAGMCRSAKEITDTMGAPVSDLSSHEKKIHVLDMENELSISLPFMHQDHAVMLVSSNIEMAADRLLKEDTPRHTPEGNFSGSSAGLSFQLDRIVELIGKAAEEAQVGAGDILAKTGIQSLETVELAFRALGPAVLSEFGAKFNQKDRGLLGILMPETAKKTPLIDILPRNAAQASALPFDMTRAYRVVKAFAESIEDQTMMSFEELLEEFHAEFGIRLKEDLLDTFGEGYFAVVMESEDDLDITNPASQLNGMAFGLGMKDGATFGKSVDAMLRSAGLHAGRKKSDYKGFQLNALNIAMLLDLHYVVTDDLFMVGVGNAGEEAIQATLDMVLKRGAEEADTSLPKTVTNRTRMVPGGWTGLGWTNMVTTMWSISQLLDMMATEAPPELEPIFAMFDKLPVLMDKYNLKHTVSVLRTTGNRWMSQSIW